MIREGLCGCSWQSSFRVMDRHVGSDKFHRLGHARSPGGRTSETTVFFWGRSPLFSLDNKPAVATRSNCCRGKMGMMGVSFLEVPLLGVESGETNRKPKPRDAKLAEKIQRRLLLRRASTGTTATSCGPAIFPGTTTLGRRSKTRLEVFRRWDFRVFLGKRRGTHKSCDTPGQPGNDMHHAGCQSCGRKFLVGQGEWWPKLLGRFAHSPY